MAMTPRSDAAMAWVSGPTERRDQRIDELMTRFDPWRLTRAEGDELNHLLAEQASDARPFPTARAPAGAFVDRRSAVVGLKSAAASTTAEHVITVGAAVVGFVTTPLLNQRIEARPFGVYVPPSVCASLFSIVAGIAARRAGYRKTGKAGVALGVGLAVGTAVSAKTEGGVMASRR